MNSRSRRISTLLTSSRNNSPEKSDTRPDRLTRAGEIRTDAGDQSGRSDSCLCSRKAPWCSDPLGPSSRTIGPFHAAGAASWYSPVHSERRRAIYPEGSLRWLYRNFIKRILASATELDKDYADRSKGIHGDSNTITGASLLASSIGLCSVQRWIQEQFARAGANE